MGIASSVVPYVCDQLAMARLPRETYSLLVALLPATATAIGVLVLAQFPSPVELAGVALVVIAVALHRERAVYEPVTARRFVNEALSEPERTARRDLDLGVAGGRARRRRLPSRPRS